MIGEFGRVFTPEEAERLLRARYEAGWVPFQIYEPGQAWHGADVSYPVGGDWQRAWSRQRTVWIDGLLARNAARLAELRRGTAGVAC